MGRNLEDVLTIAGFVSNRLDLCLWTHAGKQAALAYHVDGLPMAGTRETIQEVLAELSTDLETVANEVTNKPSRYLDRTLVKTSGIQFWNRFRTRRTTRQRSKARLDCAGTT